VRVCAKRSRTRTRSLPIQTALDEAVARSRKHHCQTNEDVVVTGDFNIAPTDIDVWDPAVFIGATHTSEPERKVLSDLCAWGLTDIFREQHPEPKLFSWWDYRDGSFHKGHGMRIDYLLVTKSLAAKTTETAIDRNARKGEKPSDHAPVTMIVS